MLAYIKNYYSRHKNTTNLILHILGIPLVLLGVFQLLNGTWKLGAINFFLGYLFQWMGHTRFEKNELGEWTLIKNLWLKRR